MPKQDLDLILREALKLDKKVDTRAYDVYSAKEVCKDHFPVLESSLKELAKVNKNFEYKLDKEADLHKLTICHIGIGPRNYGTLLDLLNKAGFKKSEDQNLSWENQKPLGKIERDGKQAEKLTNIFKTKTEVKENIDKVIEAKKTCRVENLDQSGQYKIDYIHFSSPEVSKAQVNVMIENLTEKVVIVDSFGFSGDNLFLYPQHAFVTGKQLREFTNQIETTVGGRVTEVGIIEERKKPLNFKPVATGTSARVLHEIKDEFGRVVASKDELVIIKESTSQHTTVTTQFGKTVILKSTKQIEPLVERVVVFEDELKKLLD